MHQQSLTARVLATPMRSPSSGRHGVKSVPIAESCRNQSSARPPCLQPSAASKLRADKFSLFRRLNSSSRSSQAPGFIGDNWVGVVNANPTGSQGRIRQSIEFFQRLSCRFSEIHRDQTQIRLTLLTSQFHPSPWRCP